jgi:hypothetical protein
MLDIVNDETTQANARTLNDLFAGKQVVNSRDLDLPARSVAFTDGTHVTIQAATALPNGTRLNANGLAMDSDNFTNDNDDYYNGKYDSGRIVRAWVETTSEFTDTNGMSAPQVERTITLWALAENNMRPEKIAEVSGEYAAHSDLRPTLIIKYGDTRISAADAALEPQW